MAFAFSNNMVGEDLTPVFEEQEWQYSPLIKTSHFILALFRPGVQTIYSSTVLRVYFITPIQTGLF